MRWLLLTMLLAGCAAGPDGAPPGAEEEAGDFEATSTGPAWFALSFPRLDESRVDLSLDYADPDAPDVFAAVVAGDLVNATMVPARSTFAPADHGETASHLRFGGWFNVGEPYQALVLTNAAVTIRLGGDASTAPYIVDQGDLRVTTERWNNADLDATIEFEREAEGFDGLLIVWDAPAGVGTWYPEYTYTFPDGQTTGQDAPDAPGATWAGPVEMAQGDDGLRSTFTHWMSGFATRQPASPSHLELGGVVAGVDYLIYHMAGDEPFPVA